MRVLTLPNQILMGLGLGFVEDEGKFLIEFLGELGVKVVLSLKVNHPILISLAGVPVYRS